MKYTVATKWNDLNPWQLSKIAWVMFADLDEKQKKYRLVYYLFMGKLNFWRALKMRVLINRVPFFQLYPYTAFINSTTNLTEFPKILRLGSIKLYGPSPRLASCRIDQFSLADTFYYRWCKTRKVQELNRLVSVLYLPKGKTFSKTDLDHSRYVKLMPMGQKLGVFLAYMGCRELLQASFTHVFPKSKGSGSADYASFDKIIYTVARGESKPFGGVYQTKEALLYDFMNVLNDELADQKEYKRKWNTKP